MKQNMVETLLGAFVLIVAITFFIYGSGKTSGADTSSSYKVTAQFADIGGLSVGDDVKISGVPIGTIAAIDLDQAYFASVTMAVKDSVKLPVDTAARISSEGLLGGTYMALDIGADETTLTEGGAITVTQSAQNLEQLLGQFIFSLNDSKDKGDSAASAPEVQ